MTPLLGDLFGDTGDFTLNSGTRKKNNNDWQFEAEKRSCAYMSQRIVLFVSAVTLLRELGQLLDPTSLCRRIELGVLDRQAESGKGLKEVDIRVKIMTELHPREFLVRVIANDIPTFLIKFVMTLSRNVIVACVVSAIILP